jgi:polysaccharide deacetylase family protein (PEP-CTERM system associated)
LFWLPAGLLAFLMGTLALNALGMLPAFAEPGTWVEKALELAPLICLGLAFLALGALLKGHPDSDPQAAQAAEAKHISITQGRPHQGRGSFPAGDKCSVTRHIFTIDLEDYFHTEAAHSLVGQEEWNEMPSRVEESMDRLLALLAEHDATATVFALGWVAQKHPGLIRKIQSCGHELACHSYLHRPVFRLTAEEFRRDTERAKKTIEDACGSAVLGYRAPNFSIIDQTPWAYSILADLGFVYDSSTHPIHHDISNNPHAPQGPHLVADGQLLELPISTLRLAGINWPIGGGGYFRMLPYLYSAAGLKAWTSQNSHPAVFYIHPWELDIYQPRLLLPAKSRLRQYSGLGLTEIKLEKLLSTYRFASVAQVYGEALDGMTTAATHLEAYRMDAYA